MDSREKLVELLAGNIPCTVLGIGSCDTCPYRHKEDCYTEAVVDHLIAHGVTVSDEIAELQADNERLREMWAKAVSQLSKVLAPAGGCDGCRWSGSRHQKCSCCRRNRYLKDCYEG